MADFDTQKISNKYSTDELQPLLSLNPKKETRDEKKSHEEQEALWTRSLAFFENMKKNSQQA